MCQIPENFVTSDLVFHQRCDKTKSFECRHEFSQSRKDVRFMYVFEHGDLALAAHYLAERMHEPFEPLPIACVAVQQTVLEEFIERVRSKFHQVKPHVANHPHFERTLQELEDGGISYIIADIADAPPFASPILVTGDISHLFFSKNPSGAVILRTFENMEEAQEVFLRETLSINAVIIFDESITNVYNLAANIKCSIFFVNCFDVCIMPILPFYAMQKACAMMHNGQHFENIQIGRDWKIIVFPYTTTLETGCHCLPGQCTCRSSANTCSANL